MAASDGITPVAESRPRVSTPPWAALAAIAVAAVLAGLAWWRPAIFASRPASLTASAATLVSLAAAAAAILRTRRVPIWARLVLALLAAYGAAAVAAAVWTGANYPSMLRGASPWQALPWFLRGAVVGACVVLPIAAVIQGIKTGLRGWRAPTSTASRELREGLVYALVAATAWGSVREWTASPNVTTAAAKALALPAAATAPAQALPQSLPAPDPNGPDPLELLRSANALADAAPAVDWDLQARAATLQPGIDPSFQYVRDQTRFEAYPGVLRGADGTYTARAGNAADRALMLAALLGAKGVRTRFAVGTVGPDVQDRLWRQMFDSTVQGPPLPSISTGTRGLQLRQRIFDRARHDYGVVRAALGDGLPPVTDPSREQVLAEMNPHVWVQAEVDGRWVDLDPSLRENQPGAALGTVVSTADELPSDFYQRVTMRVVLEQLTGGTLARQVVAQLSAPVSDIRDRQVFLIHTPGDPSALGALGSAIVGHNAWTPAFWFDGELAAGTTFTIDEGSPSSPRPADEKPKGLGDVGGLLSAGEVNAPEPTASSGPIFVAEWLEFELTAPGVATETSSRCLVERAGVAWRAKAPLDPSRLTALSRNDKGPLAFQALHNVWFSTGAHNLAEFADGAQQLGLEQLDALTAATGRPGATAAPAEQEFPGSVWPFALQNFTWLIWTDHLVIPGLNDLSGLRLYFDRPRISIFSAVPETDGAVSTLSDLRRDNLRAVAVDESARPQLAEKKLWFGMLEGALEHEALAEAVALAGPGGSIDSTSARLSGGSVVVVRQGHPVSAAAVRAVDPETAARLDGAIARGSVAVVPDGGLGPHGSWWEIAAARGDAAAVGELGLNIGRGRPPPTPQQNPYGGPRGYNVGEGAAERNKLLADIERQKAQAEIHAKHMRREQWKRRGEYALLVAAIALAQAGAVIYIGHMTAIGIASAVGALSGDK